MMEGGEALLRGGSGRQAAMGVHGLVCTVQSALSAQSSEGRQLSAGPRGMEGRSARGV